MTTPQATPLNHKAHNQSPMAALSGESFPQKMNENFFIQPQYHKGDQPSSPLIINEFEQIFFRIGIFMRC